MFFILTPDLNFTGPTFVSHFDFTKANNFGQSIEVGTFE